MIGLREATGADADSIARLHASSWLHTYRGIMRDAFLDGDVLANRLETWRKRMTQPPANQYVVVALDGAAIAGFACLYGNEDKTWGTMLDNLHVDPLSKGRGIGKQLIAHAARWSLERHPSGKFYLWVFEKNIAARNFYMRLGAAHVETVETEPPGGGRAVEYRYAWGNLDTLIERANSATSTSQ